MAQRAFSPGSDFGAGHLHVAFNARIGPAGAMERPILENGRGQLWEGITRLWQRAPRGELAFRDERPLRSELFSTDQLEQHAKALAGWHQVASNAEPDQLLGRLEQNEAVLLEAHQLEIDVDPRLDPLRDDPRFAAVRQAAGFGP